MVAPELKGEHTGVSPTWYTWLEQGRGGAPSADVLDRIAKGLMLTEPEREHIYMLGLGRPPEARYQPVDSITPRLQRVLELSYLSPEFKALWQDNDVVAHGEGVKRIHHPDAGLMAMEFSSFAVEGRPELGMIIYNPASEDDAERLRVLLDERKD